MGVEGEEGILEVKNASVRAILDGVRFKPGWNFKIDDSGDIEVSVRVTNSYKKGPRRVTVRGYVVDPRQYKTEQHLLEQIYEAISSVLHHEASEWFRYRGHRWFDPHR